MAITKSYLKVDNQTLNTIIENGSHLDIMSSDEITSNENLRKYLQDYFDDLKKPL